MTVLHGGNTYRRAPSGSPATVLNRSWLYIVSLVCRESTGWSTTSSGISRGTGVEYIFGVDGANIEDLYDAAYFRPDITAVLAKHEFSAATMADGYSRSGAGLGVVAATSGGGALNLIPALGESFTSRIPVLALVGQPATRWTAGVAFRTPADTTVAERRGVVRPESVFCKRVRNAADIVSVLPAAIAAAHSGGPAVLLLPKDIQQSLSTAAARWTLAGTVRSATHTQSCVRCGG